MMFRTVLFWTHLGSGILAGLVIFTMSVTGIVLAFERQIVAWADHAAIENAGEGPLRLPLDEVLGAVSMHAPGVPVTAITLRADPDLPVAVALGRERVAYLSPWTGAVLGEGAPGVRKFFGFVTSFHRWFSLGEASRETARAITGVANLVFVFIILSGSYLWLPRIWRVTQLRMRLWFNRGYRDSKARDWTWHHVFGFWMWLPLLLIATSALVFSYGWANALLFRAFGEEPPLRRSPPTSVAGSFTLGPTGEFGRLFQIAASGEAYWRSITLRLPLPDDGSANFIIDRGDGGQPQLQTNLLLDISSGAVLHRKAFGDQSAGSRARSVVRRLHTGEIFGLAGQVIAAAASLAAVLMVWTGLALAWRRLISPLLRSQSG